MWVSSGVCVWVSSGVCVWVSSVCVCVCVCVWVSSVCVYVGEQYVWGCGLGVYSKNLSVLVRIYTMSDRLGIS